MRQPCPDELSLLPARTTASPDTIALWAWVGIIVAVLVFEVIMIRTGHSTLSQAVQHQPAWFRWAALGGVVILGLHLLGVL
jgi:cytochrome c biogenesis protein CcdA